jgi:hypothetical protein
MSLAVRNVLLRALFDTEFHKNLLSDAAGALAEYDLTNEERQALTKPGPELYALVAPTATVSSFVNPRDIDDPPPTTVTIIIVIIVAIIVFVAATGPEVEALRSARRSQLQPLIGAIQASSGAERYDLVRTLMTELTAER